MKRPKRSPRRVSGEIRPIDWHCAFCNSSDANQFTRDGHYQRSLETGWGHLDTLRVPMVECQRCQHDVVAHFAILEKYQRFWLDAPQRAIFGSGLCQSLRHLSQQWAATLGSTVGLRTINERINQLEALLQKAHREPISDVPAVVQFDGIWLSLQTQQEGVKEDSRKRKRHHKRGKRIVVLVALGLWTDGSQRCIFHKLRNVSNKCVGLDRERKKSLLEQAAAVYQAPTASEARARLLVFGQRWQATQPQAVATFEREFEQTIQYYSLEGMVREVVRTTSLLERTNRELRRKFRQVGCFGSPRGAEVAVYIQVTRLNAQWARSSWWEVSGSLALALLNINP